MLILDVKMVARTSVVGNVLKIFMDIFVSRNVRIEENDRCSRRQAEMIQLAFQSKRRMCCITTVRFVAGCDEAEFLASVSGMAESSELPSS